MIDISQWMKTNDFGYKKLAESLVDAGRDKGLLAELRGALKIGIPLQLAQFQESQGRLKEYAESHNKTFDPKTSAWTKYIKQAINAIQCLAQNKKFDYLSSTIPVRV